MLIVCHRGREPSGSRPLSRRRSMPLSQAGDRNVDQLLASILEKAPNFQARGGEIEQAGRMPEDVLQWIYDLRLFKLMLPQEFGGRPTPLPDMLRIFEELSAIDGSLGWLVHIGAAGGYFAPSFEKEVARELFSPREAVRSEERRVGKGSGCCGWAG